MRTSSFAITSDKSTMSGGRPLTSDEASDAQSLEDILRQMSLDQFPRFPFIVDHIARHFVNLHPDERRCMLDWLREVITTTCLMGQPLSSSPGEQAWMKNLMEDYARLSNRDPEFLPMVFEIQRWFATPEDGHKKNSALEDLHHYIQFMLCLKEVRLAMAEGRMDLTERECSSEELSAGAPQEVDPRIRDLSRSVIYLYGFNSYPKPSVDKAIQRIRHVYLAISIEKEARAVLNPDEFDRYESVLEESTQTVLKYWYRHDKEMSLDALGKLYDIAEPHEPLKRLLMEIPWYHLHQESDCSTADQ